jgi:hypothetical protein
MRGQVFLLLLASKRSILRWIERVFKRWKFSSKNVKYKNVRKFTNANIRYYLEYTTAIVNLPVLNLKYLDEARFESRSLKRKRGVSAQNRQLHGLINRAGNTKQAVGLSPLGLGSLLCSF